MQFEIRHWVSNADAMNAALKEASTGITSIEKQLFAGAKPKTWQALGMLQSARYQVEKIKVGAHTWDRPLMEASKVEAVQKGIMKVLGMLFFPRDEGYPGLLLMRQGCNGFSCSKRQTLNSSFTDVRSSLQRVLDDLHLSKVLAPVLKLKGHEPEWDGSLSQKEATAIEMVLNSENEKENVQEKMESADLKEAWGGGG